MRLYEQANFYRDRRHVVTTKPQWGKPVWEWEYETKRAQNLISEEDFQEEDRMRRQWEDFLPLWLAQPIQTSWFDPNDAKWPKHTKIPASPSFEEFVPELVELTGSNGSNNSDGSANSNDLQDPSESDDAQMTDAQDE